MKIDKFDKKILNILQSDGKISNTSLAKAIGLTAPATLERVKKLQKNGYILGYKAILDKKKLGKGLTCFIALNLGHHNRRNTDLLLEKHLKRLNDIEEINLVTGRHDYLIKVNLKDVDELREFIFEKLTKIEYISKVETFLCVASITNRHQSFISENEIMSEPGFNSRKGKEKA